MCYLRSGRYARPAAQHRCGSTDHDSEPDRCTKTFGAAEENGGFAMKLISKRLALEPGRGDRGQEQR
jgi:hypothetical protein